MINGKLTAGIAFYVGESKVEGLQSIPSLGGTANKIDITTLDDTCYRYMNGLKDYGDLQFNFLLDDDFSNYEAIKAVENTTSNCKVVIGNKKFTFSAELSASLDEAGVDAALTFTVNAGLQSDITFGANA